MILVIKIKNYGIIYNLFLKFYCINYNNIFSIDLLEKKFNNLYKFNK